MRSGVEALIPVKYNRVKHLDPDKKPKFADSESFKTVFQWVITEEKRRNPVEVIELAKKVNQCPATVYEWMHHPYTLKQIDLYIDTLMAKDKVKMYHNISKVSERNPKSQRIWLERYEKWSKPDQPHGNLQVNIFLTPQQSDQEPPQQTGYEDVTEKE
jgi:predicted MPP superfamily phosphohydrolase